MKEVCVKEKTIQKEREREELFVFSFFEHLNGRIVLELIPILNG